MQLPGQQILLIVSALVGVDILLLLVFFGIHPLGLVSRSLLWKGHPLVKEGHFYSFGKDTLKFSFTKLPLTLFIET